MALSLTKIILVGSSVIVVIIIYKCDYKDFSHQPHNRLRSKSLYDHTYLICYECDHKGLSHHKRLAWKLLHDYTYRIHHLHLILYWQCYMFHHDNLCVSRSFCLLHQ